MSKPLVSPLENDKTGEHQYISQSQIMTHKGVQGVHVLKLANDFNGG